MLYILDREQEIIGVATNSSPKALPYWEDIENETLTGVHTYTFQVPSDHEQAGLIEVEGHILLPDLDDNLRLFTIKETIDKMGDGQRIREVTCEETVINEMLTDIVKAQTLKQVDLEGALKVVLANSDWKMGWIQDTAPQDVKFEDYMTVLEALRQLESEYDVEMYATVDVENLRMSSKKLNFVDMRGNDNKISFEFGYDLKGITKTENSDNVVTALYGVGKANDKGVKVTLEGLHGFDDGDYYKLDGQGWIGSETGIQRWGINGRHRFDVFSDDKADTAEKLKTSTIKALAKRLSPTVTYSCSILTLERLSGYDAKAIRLGDTIVAKDLTYDPPLAVEGRVIEVNRSYTDPTKDTVTLGNYKPLTISIPKAVTRLQDKIATNEALWSSGLTKVEVSSNNGFIFKNGNISTTLTAKVYYIEDDITETVAPTRFVWERVSTDSSADTIWNNAHVGIGNTLTLTSDDVKSKATFTCSILTDDTTE